jgi:hypothetical protein
MSAEAQIKAPAIPEDVMNAAEDAVSQALGGKKSLREFALPVARAILAERERCAAVADRYGTFKIDTEHGEGYATAASNIAAAIRAGA